MATASASVFDCSVAEFVKCWTDVDNNEVAIVTDLLAKCAITQPRKLSNISMAQLGLPSGTPAGYLSTIAEVLEKAAELRAEQRRADQPTQQGPREEGEWRGGRHPHRTPSRSLPCPLPFPLFRPVHLLARRL